MDGFVAPPSPALTDDAPPTGVKRRKTTASQSDTPGAALSHSALRHEESYVHKSSAAAKDHKERDMASTVQGTKATSAAKPPRGRRRFMADLREAIECAENGDGYVAESYIVQGVLTGIVTRRVYSELKRVSPALRSGDDEAILCDIVSLETGDTIVSLSINITGELPSSFVLVWGHETMLMMCLPRDKDTSEYPKDHSFFAYTQDDGGSQVSQLE